MNRAPYLSASGVPLLCNGDRMTQAEFHWRYQAYPENVKFELIGGTVYMGSPMPSPLRRPHALYDEELSFALGLFRRATPGLELLPNATTILGEQSEAQPDLAMRILPEYGGQSHENQEAYVEGAPELLAEIAYSTRAIDMHQKREDYKQARVAEYVVLCIEERDLHWFDFRGRRPIRPNRQGVFRSRVFPGLWIDGPALWARDSSRIVAVVQQGLAHREHAAFVKRLEAERRRRSRS
jgi:Putative restriction endonuclease